MNTMFQAIIQGLRESGVFSSVIASAPSAFSKENFFLSIDSSNSSRAVASKSLPSRKLGKSRNYQATGRKVLDTEVAVFQEAAIPPLSPPGRDDDHFIEEAR